MAGPPDCSGLAKFVFEALAYRIMRVSRQTRNQMRSISAVVVRVRCGRCRRVLGRLYGTTDEPVEFSTRWVSGMLPRGSRIDYFRCPPRCHPDPYTVRWEKLAVAYRAVVELPPPQRVIWLPILA